MGDGTVNKTLTYVNNTVNDNYVFCATPTDRTLYVDPYVQYKQGTLYPQRIWDAVVQDYNNTITEQILYLLGSADGIYVTFQIINSADQTLEGVNINATRIISGSSVVVGDGISDASGSLTLWLNPDFSHDFIFAKTGFTTYTTSFAPTQSSYTITMVGGEGTPAEDYTVGIKTYITPKENELFNDTEYTFTFNLTSSYWDLDSFGFNLRLANGTIVGSDSSTISGTASSVTYNVINQTIIYMDYSWIINGNASVGSKYWVITNTQLTSWSIKTFFTDFNTYLSSGMFGLDNFGKYLIVFLILFISVGIMSYKYGLTSPITLVSMSFAIIFFFDIVVGLIPEIRGINHLLTYIAGIALVGLVIRETSR